MIWEKKRANAREITAAMNLIDRLLTSRVQTLLRKLEEKGAVAHDVEERTFIFFPLVEAEKVTKFALNEFIDRIFLGSPAGLVSYLLKQEDIPADEMKQIKEMLKKGK